MLKYLLLILFIVLVIWLTRLLRPHDSPRAAGRKAPPRGRADPQSESLMVACAHCGLHLPRVDALPGRGGIYCSEAHRAIVEARDAGG